MESSISITLHPEGTILMYGRIACIILSDEYFNNKQVLLIREYNIDRS